MSASVGCSGSQPAAVAVKPAAVAREEQPLPAPERMTPGDVAAPFTLTERNGQPFDSASLRGKVWMASVF
ncbi:MAG: hypothetical protein ACKOHK_03405, partial [Planctomycetia bacterium]